MVSWFTLYSYLHMRRLTNFCYEDDSDATDWSSSDSEVEDGFAVSEFHGFDDWVSTSSVVAKSKNSSKKLNFMNSVICVFQNVNPKLMREKLHNQMYALHVGQLRVFLEFIPYLKVDCVLNAR